MAAIVPFIPVLLDLAGKIFERVAPDPQKKAEMELEMFRMIQSGELAARADETKLALAQAEINKVEAATDGIFKGGWRPFVGWTCGGGLFYQLLFRPIFGWIMENLLQWTHPPGLEMETLMTLLFGMLGFGAYRTFEKVKKSN